MRLQSSGLLGSADREFVGRFPSWTNIKTAYGAKIDGTCSCN